MAKKKDENIQDGDTIVKSIKSDFGDNVLVNANYILERKKVVIPIGPALDSICGGIPEGSYVIFTGPPKAGKSLTSLYFAATAQDMKYAGELCPNGREVYYYNIEGRLKERDIEGIPHLCRERFFVIQSNPKKILTASDYLEIADRLINTKPGSIHILDSFSALCTEAEKTGGMSDMQRADGPKLLAKFCRKICNVTPVNNTIVIGITHQMANVTGYGSPTSEKSGNSLKYQVDVKFMARKIEKWSLKDGDPPIGQSVDWECQATALNIAPWGKATSYLRYGMGIDKTQELVIMAADLGVISEGGAGWFTLPMFDNMKLQGRENVRRFITETEGAYEKVYQELRNIIG
jgi:RecA/RadA recombinase